MKTSYYHKPYYGDDIHTQWNLQGSCYEGVTSYGPVSEVGLEIKQLTRIKQSQIKQPWQGADALSEPESIHGTGHALSLAQIPKPDHYLPIFLIFIFCI
jgi:hypothetical protein